MIPGRKQGDFEAGNVRNLGIPGTHTMIPQGEPEIGSMLRLSATRNLQPLCFVSGLGPRRIASDPSLLLLSIASQL